VTVRRLVLVRHAHAERGAEDAQRVLTEDGKSEARAIGRWLAEQNLVPDRVVISPARRAVETWELAAQTGGTSDPALDPRIYQNTVDSVLAVLRETPPDAHTLVLVGHNPAIQDLATELDDGRGDARQREKMSRKFPPAAAALFELGVEWSGSDRGTGSLVAFSGSLV
jgi:phosphohistidine phosphatase